VQHAVFMQSTYIQNYFLKIHIQLVAINLASWNRVVSFFNTPVVKPT